MTNNNSEIDKPILWKKALAIAMIQGSITLTWLVYNLYLPDFLKQLGLGAGLAKILLIIEHFLEVIIEPIAGNFSDQQERKIGTRLPIITFGIITTGIFFLSLPILGLWGSSAVKWLFILGAILWVSAMAVFRSPVMSLLRKSASRQQLSQSASLITLIVSIVGAFKFDVFAVILKMGAGFAFCLATVVLLLSGWAIQKVFPPPSSVDNQDHLDIATPPIPPIPFLNLSLIIGTGFSVGFGLKFFFPVISATLNLQLGEGGKLGMMIFSILLGLSALGTGKIATKLGNGQGFFFGLITTTIFLPIAVFSTIKWITFLAIIILLIAFSFVLNGVYPFILSLVPKEKTGFGMGLYFGCFGGAISGFVILGTYITQLTPQLNAIGGAISFLIATLLVYVSLIPLLNSKQRLKSEGKSQKSK